jgi:diaminopimelate decarboxylase
MNMDVKDQEIINLSDRLGTPFFLYDGDFLENHYKKIRNQLSPDIDIFLSMKANNNISIARLFGEYGGGVEVASKGEIFLALKSGYSPKNIIFSGPGKTMEELTYAIELEIYSIIVESIDELEKIEVIAQQKGKVVSIAVRINPDQALSTGSIQMAGAPRQFGIDESQLVDFYERACSLSNIRLMGIHVYTGTQILDGNQIMRSFQNTINIAEMLYEKFNFICEMIDLGGGFGVPYFSNEQQLDFETLSHEINKLVVEAKNKIFKETRFIIESGRYLLSEGGCYITKVLYKKKSKNEIFLIVDGGLHHHSAATFRGRRMRGNFPMKVIQTNKLFSMNSNKETVNIVGPLCTPDDCLFKGIEINQTEPGDIICIYNSGAYGLTFSPIYFLGHPTPIEIMRINNKYKIIREKGNESDLLLRQSNITIG